jgi:hypothetical protein
MSTAIKVEGHAQATWRTDPTKNGSSGSIGDIGKHASQLAGFVTSLKLENLSADLATFVDGRALGSGLITRIGQWPRERLQT